MAKYFSCGPTVIVRPPAAEVHCARNGHSTQAAPNAAAPIARLPARGRIGTVTPAGQVTDIAPRSTPKRSLEKCPRTVGDGCTFTPL